MKRGPEDDSRSDSSGSDDAEVDPAEEATPGDDSNNHAEQSSKRSNGKTSSAKTAPGRAQTSRTGKEPQRNLQHMKPFAAPKKSGSAYDAGESTKMHSSKKSAGGEGSNPLRKKPAPLNRSLKKPSGDNAALSMRYACLAEGSLAKDNAPYRYTRKEYFAENGLPQDEDDEDDQKLNEQSGSRIKDAAKREAAKIETYLFNPDAMMYFTEADLMNEEDLEKVIKKYFETSQVPPTLEDKPSQASSKSPAKNQ